MQNLKTARTKLRNGQFRSKTTLFQPCTVSSSSSFGVANPPAKKSKNVKCQCPCLAKTQRLIPIVMKIDAPGR